MTQAQTVKCIFMDCMESFMLYLSLMVITHYELIIQYLALIIYNSSMTWFKKRSVMHKPRTAAQDLITTHLDWWKYFFKTISTICWEVCHASRDTKGK